MKKIAQYLVLSLCVALNGVACALALRVAIGVGPYDALTQNLSELIHIKVGTMGMILNISCVVGQLILLKKKFNILHFLQIPLSILFGMVVNFMFYEIFVFEVPSYWLKVIILAGVYVWCGFAVGGVMVINKVTFALEGLCMVVSQKIHKKFHIVRQGVDVLSIILCLIFTFGFGLPLVVREGTVMGMLIYGPSLGIAMKIEKRLFKKLNLLDYE